MNILEKIKNQIDSNKVILYMKGDPDFPQCGFSARACHALHDCNVDFAHVDILVEQDIRVALPEYADWPTFPQLWVNGELVGGCDIIVEMHASGELQTLLTEAVK